MNPHRLAVVGCGRVSDMHFAAYAARPDRVSVVAACDPDPAQRERVRREHGVAATFATVDELLAGADFDIGVVCTPSTIRVDTVRALAAEGRHVFVEKPMAASVEEGEEIVAACAAAGVLLAVDQNFRWHYGFELARDVIRSGRIGTVLGIDHVELTFRDVHGWRARSAQNALSVMGVHWFDGFRRLLGSEADMLVAVTHSSSALEAAGETDAFVHIRFGDVAVNYTQSFSSHFERTETIIFGDRGTLALDYDGLRLRTDAGEAMIANPFSGDAKPASTFCAIALLCDAADGGGEPSNGGVDNLKTLGLVEGAYRSAATNRSVEFEHGLPR